MHALSIPTTRSLSVISTGETVQRETALPGALLVRVAQSHIRVGTFQYLAAAGEREILRLLANHAIARHPETAEESEPYPASFRAVLVRQAALMAKWLHVGFVHGVMNTDNVAICGETIDYGPCAFLDAYDPDAVFSSIDLDGRYAYGHQPSIMLRNLTRFAEALLPLFHEDEEQAREVATALLDEFPAVFRHEWVTGMAAKLGLAREEEDDAQLIQELLYCMYEYQADYTTTLRALLEETRPALPFFQERAFLSWREKWRARLARQGDSPAAVRERMHAVNPTIRNCLVEEALEAVTHRNFAPAEQLLVALARPYEIQTGHEALADPPMPLPYSYKTFCGT